jgi:hypothetical protein
LDTLASSKRWLQVLALGVGLAACGGGGDDNKAPVAAIVDPVDRVALIGTGGEVSFSATCVDPEGDAITNHAWSFLRADDGGTLATSTEAAPSVTFDVDGQYKATYRCRDSKGHWSATRTANVVVNGSGSSGFYGIELKYLTIESENYAALFEAAAVSIAGFVIGDVADVNETLPAYPECGGMPEVSSVDDLVIFVEVLDLDGENGILAQSGPCYIRSSSKLPIAGVIQIDENDVDNPALEAVILHEMLHVVGFGTVWPEKKLLGGANGTDPYFSGARARTAFLESNGGDGYTLGRIVPVENNGDIGDGTRNSHWRESVFGTELMTGFLGDAPSPPLSRTTIESLGDLGYLVYPSAADDFSIIPMDALQAEGAPGEKLFLGDDVLPVVPREVGGL